ncbi:hypothetical protein ACFWAA_31590 [Streptomyces sp. NPDC059922]|uniref:hypothetical protein n=1 Tax=Streptomyces sp. NPDC059922 TaxID=3347005 RepID=UPI00364B3043
MSKLTDSRGSCVAIACVALVLLAGCGGNSESEAGGSDGKPLNAQETQAILPDAKAMPGWRVSLAPTAYPLEEAVSKGVTRCHGEEGNSCDNVQFTGASTFLADGKPVVSFLAFAYKDTASAESAYESVWEAWKERTPEARKLNLGAVGERRDAVRGLNASMDEGSKGAIAQVRVGAVIVLVTGEAAPKVDMADTLITKFATTFSERAREAQDGKTPTATLGA